MRSHLSRCGFQREGGFRAVHGCKQVRRGSGPAPTVRLGRVRLDGTRAGERAKHQPEPGGMRTSWSSSWRGRSGSCWSWRSKRTRIAEAEPGAATSRKSCERREERLAAIQEAKEKIEERAQERYEAERAEYEEKLKRRLAQQRLARRWAGPPKEPEADRKTRTKRTSRMKNHGSCRARTGDFIQGYNARRSERTVTWWWRRMGPSRPTTQEMERGGGTVEEGRRRTGQAGSAGGGPGTTARRTWSGAWNSRHRAVYRGQPGTPQPAAGRSSRCAPGVSCGCGCGDGDEASFADG